MAIRLTAGINLLTIAILVIVVIIHPHETGGGIIITNLVNLFAGFAAAKCSAPRPWKCFIHAAALAIPIAVYSLL